MQPEVSLNNLAAAKSTKIAFILYMLVSNFLRNVNNMRAVIGLCLLGTSHWGEIWDPWQSQAFTIAHMVFGL